MSLLQLLHDLFDVVSEPRPDDYAAGHLIDGVKHRLYAVAFDLDQFSVVRHQVPTQNLLHP